MRPLVAVVGDPSSEPAPGVVEPEEQRLVQESIAHPAVEALDEGVLHRRARCDEVPVDRVLQRRLRDPVHASQIGRLRVGLVLLQNRTVCSSLNRFRFICPSFVRRTLNPSVGNSSTRSILAQGAADRRWFQREYYMS